MKEVKIVFTKKHEFDNWDESILKPVFGIFPVPAFSWKDIGNDFSFEYFSIKWRFRNVTLMEKMVEIKSVVTEKIEFVYRGRSWLTTLFGFFRSSTFWWMDQKKYFSQRMLLYISELFNCDLDGASQSCS